MRIRKFQKKDIRDVAKIKNKVFSKFNSSDVYDKRAIDKYLSYTDLKKSDEELLKAMSGRNNEIFFVAEEGEKIVGYINGDKHYLKNLFVYGSKHKKGIGKKLYDKFEKEAVKKGSKEIKLKSSIYAVGFYEKMGFKKTTGVRNFRGIKVWPMRKVLK